MDEIGSISTDTTGKGAQGVGRGRLFSRDTEERAEQGALLSFQCDGVGAGEN